MSKPRLVRVNKNPLPPLQPMSADTPLPAASSPTAPTSKPTQPYALSREDESRYWRRVIRQERKRHGHVEGILTNHITALEHTNDDLRKHVTDLQSLVIANTAAQLTSKGKQ